MAKTIKKIDHASPERRKVEASLNRVLKNGGIKALAAQLVEPVKYTMDAKGIIRQIFVVVDNYPKGFDFKYDKDLDRTPAISTSKMGGVFQLDVSPERVYVGEMPIQSRVYVPREDLYTKSYDVAKRAKERVAEGLTIREDLIGFSLLSAAANSGLGHPVVATAGVLDKTSLSHAFAYIEDTNLNVRHIAINAHGKKGIRRIPRNEFDDKGMQELREKGIIGSLWGAVFIESFLIQIDRAYVVSDPEYVGQLFLRTDQLIDAVEEPQRQRVGFIGYELLGMVVHNAKGVVEIQYDPNA